MMYKKTGQANQLEEEKFYKQVWKNWESQNVLTVASRCDSQIHIHQLCIQSLEKSSRNFWGNIAIVFGDDLGRLQQYLLQHLPDLHAGLSNPLLLLACFY